MRHNRGLELCMEEIEKVQGGCFCTADLPGWRWLERQAIRELALEDDDQAMAQQTPMDETERDRLREETVRIMKEKGWIEEEEAWEKEDKDS